MKISTDFLFGVVSPHEGTSWQPIRLLSPWASNLEHRFSSSFPILCAADRCGEASANGFPNWVNPSCRIASSCSWPFIFCYALWFSWDGTLMIFCQDWFLQLKAPVFRRSRLAYSLTHSKEILILGWKVSQLSVNCCCLTEQDEWWHFCGDIAFQFLRPSNVFTDWRIPIWLLPSAPTCQISTLHGMLNSPGLLSIRFAVDGMASCDRIDCF